jgi:Fic family protein
LKFFLRGISIAAAHATDTARRIVSLRETHRRDIAEKFGNHGGKALRLLESLYLRPYISINMARDALGISFPNASALIDKFVQQELLAEITGNARNRMFMYAPYIELFSNI